MNDRLKQYLAPYASLKLTVALFGMSTFLVFAGTVAQVDKGIWTVVDEYFRCSIAWIEFRVFFPRDWNIPGGFWFPGGWTLCGLLFMNVLSAHLIRFKIYATGGRLVAGLVVLALGILVTWLEIAGVFDSEIAATEDAAFWRVLLRLGKGGGAAGVLMAGCILVFKRRAGVVLLHSGIILMLVSEFVTGTYSEEGRMRISAGESVNFVEHMRSVELAFIDRSDPETDQVTVIPRRRLRGGGVIQDDQLPVDVEIIQYMKNSRLVDAASVSFANPATAGAGLRALAIEQPEVSGTDEQQTLDLPALYFTLRHKSTGQPVGTYLATPWLQGSMLEHQEFRVDGRPYDVKLRFARTYKPYEIELLEFRHDKYVGTETPKNFSSLVRVVDRDKGIDRVVKIWMNNPLRYAGETFYQSSFEPGKNLTILQVVRNGGWMIPYLACMIVGVG
ncbi:MAG: cytochrome c biogenesis protein ResB, partial [Phycisphaerales bacterium]